MVHLSDLSWDQRGEDAIQNYRKGDMVKAAVTEVDTDKERISLSIKALGDDTFSEAIDGVKRGSVITVTVTAIEDGGVEVEYNGMKSFIRRSDLSRDRAEQRPERFQVGDHVDARVTNVDAKTRRLGLSIKAREIAEEKEAVEQYGSSELGREPRRHPWRRAQGRQGLIPTPVATDWTAPLRRGRLHLPEIARPGRCGSALQHPRSRRPAALRILPKRRALLRRGRNSPPFQGLSVCALRNCPYSRPITTWGRIWPTTGGIDRMIRSELIQKIADDNPHLYQRDVEKIVNTIFEEIIEALSRGDRVELRGFGAFSVKTARCPRRPQSAHRRGGRG